MIAHTIQMSLTPVFLLVAIGNILNILTTRLGRIVDRMNAMRDRHIEDEGASTDWLIDQMRALDMRIHLNNQAHLALVMAGIAVGMTVSILFVGELIGHPLEQVAGVAFMVAIGLLMWGLMLFLRETRVAASTLRLPRTMFDRPGFDRPGFDRPGFDRPGFDRPDRDQAGDPPSR